MVFNFPKIRTTRSANEQARKILEEVEEFLAAQNPKDKEEEAVDILQTVETLLRLCFRNPKKLDQVIKKVRNKNLKRGYYTRAVY